MRDDVAAKAQRSIEKSQNQSWLPLLVVSAAGLIMVLNVAALNMALGAIVVSLHAPVSSVQLAIVAYSRAAKPVRETIRMKNDRNKARSE
jgi:multisubunit Na+/H+ antiporter MnhG subunit